MSKSGRYVFVDALRGIAALAVVFHHLVHNSSLEGALRHYLPRIVLWIGDYGAYGVQIFFIISGFVIAHSLRNTILTKENVGSFILRRQLRLDIPYWAMLAIALLLEIIRRYAPGLSGKPLPGLGTILANMFYLQNMLRLPVVLSVSWTLCLEIQFYLVFILLLYLVKRNSADPRISNIGVAVFALSAIASLISTHWPYDGAYFPPYWWYFAAGVLTNWALKEVVAKWQYLSLLAFFVGWAAYHRSPPLMVGAVTAGTIYFVGIKGRLETLLNYPFLQYLGKISYSLYLVHLPFVIIVLNVGWRFAHDRPIPVILCFLVGLITSIIEAQLFYQLIERPSLQFSNRFKRSPQPDASTT